MAQSALTLKLLPELFGILKLPQSTPFPDWLRDAPLFFAARTEDELSVMCPQATLPAGLDYSANWNCLRVHGELAFDEVGVAARLARPLAEAGLSIFVVSTHDRDYVFVAQGDLATAINTYEKVGFTVIRQDNI